MREPRVIERTECPEHGDNTSWWAASGPLGCNQCQRSGPALVRVRYVEEIADSLAPPRKDADA